MSVSGCLPDYKIGLSIPIWIAYYISGAIVGFLFLLKARRADLINRKELYRVSALFFLFQNTIGIFLFQLAVFIPKYFYLLTNLGWICTAAFTLPFAYYWEKYTVNLKKIPTIISSILLILSLLNFMLYLIYGTVPESLVLLFMVFIVSVMLLFIVLIVKFILTVVGKLRNYGIILFCYIICILLAAILDHPPGCMVPYSSIISPILFLLAVIFYYFGLSRVIDSITTFYSQIHICTIHRGKIEKGQHIYYCPSCNTTYCERCYDQVIKSDGCWNCGYGLEDDKNEAWKIKEPDIVGEKSLDKNKKRDTNHKKQ